jgi:hypothetical protein
MKKMKYFSFTNGQAGQDSFVLNMAKEKNKGYYVEIGSALPTFHSNTFILENIYGWKGISIDLNPTYVDDFNRVRSNKCLQVDATEFDYELFFEQNNFPKQIDYLQIDIDPAYGNLLVLKKLPLSNYRFTVITFEHDLYTNPGNAEVKESAHQILSNFGYVRFADNVMVKFPISSKKWKPFEDWYLDASVVSGYNPETSHKNLPWPKLFKFSLRTRLKFFLRKLKAYQFVPNRYLDYLLRIIYVFLYTHKFVLNRVSLTREKQFILGEKRLINFWSKKNNLKNPLLLNIVKTSELALDLYPLKYSHAPSIQIKDQIIKVFYRISNYSVSTGIEAKKYLPIKLSEFESLASCVITTDLNLPVISPIDQKLISIDTVFMFNDDSKELEVIHEKVMFLDPRAHQSDDSIITCSAYFGNFLSKSSDSYIGMAIIDLNLKTALLISSVYNKEFEKNWIVAKTTDKEIKMLRSTHPLIFLDINRSNGKGTLDTSIKSSNSTHLNGGSAFCLVENNFYLRVARSHFKIRGIGSARLNYLVMHNLKLEEIHRSKPFAFREVGIEICNGLEFKDGVFYFAWSENEKKIFVGKCNKDELLTWFYKNTI